MKYQQPTFSAPVSNGKLTQEQYEISVGKRCGKCKKEFQKTGIREGFLRLEGLRCGCKQ